MGRTNSSGVAVHKPNFSPDVAVRVAPVPQDDAARSRSSSAHVHVSSEVDAHLAFGVLVRRAASALARCYRVGVVRLSAIAAATSATLSSDSAALGSACFRSPARLGRRRRCAALQKSSVAVDRQARDGCKQRSAELSALVFASVVCAKSRPKVKPGLRRLQRLSGARLVMDQRTLGGVQKF